MQNGLRRTRQGDPGEVFHGVNGEPVVSKKNGYYGWEAQYDEHGNQTVLTYLGKDGKPTARR